MKENCMLLDFIVIGAAKSGTTALYKYLQQHPMIYMPEIKEPRYFCCDELAGKHLHGAVCDYPKYAKMFVEGKKKGYTVVGEATPAYFDSEVAPENIYELVPKVKLICILRNPVDKSWSGYMMYRRDEGGKDDYKELVGKGRFLSGVNYSRNINRYYKYFERDQFLFIKYDDFLVDYQKTMTDVCEFLGIDNYVFSELQKVNISGVPRYRFLNKILLIEDSWVKMGLKSIVPMGVRVVHRKIRDYYFRKFLRREKMSRENRLFAYEKIKADIELTENLTGLDLNSWKIV